MVKSEIISKLSKKIHPKLKKSDLETILDTFLIQLQRVLMRRKAQNFANLEDFHQKN